MRIVLALLALLIAAAGLWRGQPIYLLYALLWAPTGLPLLWLLREGGEAAWILPSSALCGYLGVFLTGQSALAFGLLASVIAPTQLIAATLTFVLLSLLLLSGLVVDAYSVDPWLRGVLSYAHQFRHMDELARGIVDSRRLLYHGSLTALCLLVATILLRLRPGDRRGRVGPTGRGTGRQRRRRC